MFSNYESEVIGFNSIWETEKNLKTNESQTDVCIIHEKETQTFNKKDINIQTDKADLKLDSIPLELIKQIQNAGEKIINEIKMNEISTVFKRYNPFEDEDTEKIKLQLLQQLQTKNNEYKINMHNSHFLPHNQDDNIPIIGISLNLSESILAVGSGYLYHDTWCHHNGIINIYYKRSHEDKFNFKQNLKLTSCVSSIKFHNNEALLLATGTFSGEISIWNLEYLYDNSEKDLLLASNCEMHESQIISTIIWLNSEQLNKYFPTLLRNTYEKILVTAGSNSKIIIWSVDLITSTLLMKICYKLKSTLYGKIKSSPDINHVDFIHIWNQQEISAQYNNIERTVANDYFAVGCRTGEILICKTTAKTSDEIDTDPIICNLNGHNTSILSMNFSLKNCYELLSLGADRELKIHNVLMNSPIQIISLNYNFSTANWLTINNSFILFTMATISKDEKNPIHILDVKAKQLIPIEIADDIKNSSGISCITLNKSSTKLIYGDMNGEFKIWSLFLKELQ